MITYDDYSYYIHSRGETLGDVRKNQADALMNYFFKGDVGYKRVYILDPEEGWKYTDARYSRHAIQSLSSDEVDSYLQFRPKEHYPVGTYVFIPSDTSTTMNINYDNPLRGDVSDLWLIVQRNDNKQFVRYLVLRVNWLFRWVVGYKDKRQVFQCWGCHRNANSYTSGIWRDFRVDSLDNITRAWLPDTYYLYGKQMAAYGLDDTRTITHQVRMMITNNILHPNCFMVSKVDAMAPQGLVKLTFKQDDFNEKRDNPELLICDYYNNEGDVVVKEPEAPTPALSSTIRRMEIDANGELVESSDTSPLVIGATYYFDALFADGSSAQRQWRITLRDDGGVYSDDERYALEKLMVIRDVSNTTISLRPGKSNKIKGLTYVLAVCDVYGNYASEIELEVAT